MNPVKLDTAQAADVHRILTECFTTPWSYETVESLLASNNATCFGVYEGSVLVGYIALEWVLDEGSLTDLAVLPDYRRKGYAAALMDSLIKEATEKNLSFITLEVRASNTPAIRLYQKSMFEEVGRRKGYYRNPLEDAVIMNRYF